MQEQTLYILDHDKNPIVCEDAGKWQNWMRKQSNYLIGKFSNDRAKVITKFMGWKNREGKYFKTTLETKEGNNTYWSTTYEDAEGLFETMKHTFADEPFDGAFTEDMIDKDNMYILEDGEPKKIDDVKKYLNFINVTENLLLCNAAYDGFGRVMCLFLAKNINGDFFKIEWQDPKNKQDVSYKCAERQEALEKFQEITELIDGFVSAQTKDEDEDVKPKYKGDVTIEQLNKLEKELF